MQRHCNDEGLLLRQAILPALTQLLAPPIRPVAAHLHSAEEREMLASLVDTMLSYGLQFSAATGATRAAAPAAAHAPTAALPLHPAVDQLCRYEVEVCRSPAPASAVLLPVLQVAADATVMLAPDSDGR